MTEGQSHHGIFHVSVHPATNLITLTRLDNMKSPTVSIVDKFGKGFELLLKECIAQEEAMDRTGDAP